MSAEPTPTARSTPDPSGVQGRYNQRRKEAGVQSGPVDPLTEGLKEFLGTRFEFQTRRDPTEGSLGLFIGPQPESTTVGEYIRGVRNAGPQAIAGLQVRLHEAGLLSQFSAGVVDSPTLDAIAKGIEEAIFNRIPFHDYLLRRAAGQPQRPSGGGGGGPVFKPLDEASVAEFGDEIGRQFLGRALDDSERARFAKTFRGIERRAFNTNTTQEGIQRQVEEQFIDADPDLKQEAVTRQQANVMDVIAQALGGGAGG